MRRILLIFLLMTSCSTSFAESTISEDSLKAAFIFNFISFTEWNNTRSDYYVCIPYDDNLRKTASSLFQGKLINNHKVIVNNMLEGCHVLVSNGIVSTNSTFTIGSLANGALLEFRKIDNKVKFAVDMEKVKRFKFKISSQVLKLAILENNY